ncbi:Mov34/MPN/PAD-1 family protein [Catenulispora rubra]|uniref:Mov34/MPN/PAD-1 family protein n=1 Tax=Catenulispora rubra TaxID=280293 RepID=UPI0018920B33|nr:Mov34/MPN/PAD-1 family protein [Catenulispora rubra]
MTNDLEPAENQALLTFEGGDPEDHLALARQFVDPEAELLIATATVTNISIRYRDSAELDSALQNLTERGVDVACTRSDHRPYLLVEIVVEGPDGTSYSLTGVPSTTRVEEIAAAVLSQNPEDPSRRRPIAVDRLPGEGRDPERLDPAADVHSARVEDGDVLRVGIQATAGAGLYETRLAALESARDQISGFAIETNQFSLDSVDDQNFATRFVVTFAANGFGPPDSRSRPLQPIPADRHTVRITLPPGYPVTHPTVDWLSPVFHPNIVDGTVCLTFESPALDVVCRALIDLASYRIYDVSPEDFGGGGFLDLAAAAWTVSDAGQRQIIDRGGAPAALGRRARPVFAIEPTSRTDVQLGAPDDALWRGTEHDSALPVRVHISETLALAEYASEDVEDGGFLLGSVDRRHGHWLVTITEAVRASHTQGTRTSWTVTQDSLIALHRILGDQRLVGWFHTHPADAPAEPSAADTAFHCDLFPRTWQITALVTHDAVTCYQRVGEQLTPVMSPTCP